MDELSERWMAYIDAEVREACRLRGLGYQVRRKWTVREKPVSGSPVDDYEWKLLTGDRCDRDRPELGTDESDEGRYYLLELDRARGKFILYHDNHYGGDGSFLHLATFTDPIAGFATVRRVAHVHLSDGDPPEATHRPMGLGRLPIGEMIEAAIASGVASIAIEGRWRADEEHALDRAAAVLRRRSAPGATSPGGPQVGVG